MILEEHLKQRFGHTSFRTGQKEIITSILEGFHTIAMLPTGTGKSLCYQLPGYLLEGQVIIVSPLLSLMQDQVEQLMMNGEKRVVAFNSFLSQNEKRHTVKNLHQYKFIFLSPEMLGSDFVINSLKQLKIALFVIDEAHCISQWGYDFRPDYLKLGEIRRQLGYPLTLALTATATPEVRADIKESLAIEDWNEYIYSVDRPNIAYMVEKLQNYQEKMERLIQISKEIKGPGIIYFSSKKLAEQTAIKLKERGIGRVMAYHGGMDQESRILVQQQFIHGQLDIICATSAFGMGINKENIRFVIHFHMPLQLESYLQEIGRAGRDGERSIAFLLYAPGDEQLPFQLMEGELPQKDQIDWLHSWLKHNPHALNNIAQYENELRRVAGLTEIQWRVWEDFLHTHKVNHDNLSENIAALKLFIKKRIEVKREKIEQVQRWIYSNQCRRRNILKYFDEDMSVKIENCCDICGIKLADYLAMNNNEIRQDDDFDWKRAFGPNIIE